MCLALEIELPAFASGRIGARRLARETGLYVTAYLTADPRRRFRFARGGKGCSCSLLAEDFTLTDRELPLDPESGRALAKVVSLVATVVPTFTLYSEWTPSETGPERASITCDDLISELSANKVLANAIREIGAT